MARPGEVRTFEAEMAFFGFSPLAFVDTTYLETVVNAVNDYAFDYTDEMLHTVMKKNPDANKAALRKVVDKLLNFLQDSIDKYFDKFEMYSLAEVFTIPESVPIANDLCPPMEQPEAADEDALDEELSKARTKLAAAMHVNTELKRFQKEATAIKPIRDALRNWDGLAAKAFKKAKVGAASEHVEFIYEEAGQLEELRRKAAKARAKASARYGAAGRRRGSGRNMDFDLDMASSL